MARPIPANVTITGSAEIILESATIGPLSLPEDLATVTKSSAWAPGQTDQREVAVSCGMVTLIFTGPAERVALLAGLLHGFVNSEDDADAA